MIDDMIQKILKIDLYLNKDIHIDVIIKLIISINHTSTLNGSNIIILKFDIILEFGVTNVTGV